MSRVLSLDFETRSLLDLRRTGVYPYAQHHSTGIWCMAWAFDDEEPRLWLPGEPLPEEIEEHVVMGGEMRAWNAQFERVMWNNCAARLYIFPRTRLEQWHDTAAEAAAMSLPRALGQAAMVLGVTEQKDAAGQRLMLQMCRPRRLNNAGDPVWWDVPEKIERLGAYCMQDVRTEQAIAKLVRRLGKTEREVYLLDQRINDRGIRLDLELAEAARAAAEQELDRQNALVSEATDGQVEAVTRVAKLKGWLAERGVDAPSLAKHAVRELLARGDLPQDVTDALLARSEAAKSSVAKIQAMLDCVCGDGHMRGLLLYHGASTGRWAGRLVQPQNFPRGELTPEQIEDVIYRLHEGRDVTLTEISSILRSLLIAGPGRELIVGDFSGIEARVLAWLAGQDDLVRTFEEGRDPYVEMATFLHSTTYERVTKAQRQHGKVVILGCGYGMGWKKFQATAAQNYGIELADDVAKESVNTYRSRYARIPEHWNETNAAVLRAVERPGEPQHLAHGLKYVVRSGYLWAVLPSGRPLAYPAPRIVERETPWGTLVPAVEVSGINSYTRRWERMQLYGGLLVENNVQAISRDLLAAAMLRHEQAGYMVSLTVHDEIVANVPRGAGTVEHFLGVMTERPAWALGCPVTAEGWRGERYRK